MTIALFATTVLNAAPSREWRGVRFPDTAGYLAMAETIRTGSIFSASQADTPDSGFFRTPGFPLLLAAAESIPGDLDRTILLAHSVVALIAIVIFMSAFPSGPVRTIAGFGTAYAATIAGRSFYYVLSEWLSFCELLVFFAAMVFVLRKSTFRALVGLGLICSALVLTRPVFVLLVPIPLLLAVVRGARFSGKVGTILGLSPIVLWMSLNLVRVGAFAVSPYAGYNLFPAARFLGPVETRPEDEPKLAAFISILNRDGVSPTPTSDELSITAENQPDIYNEWANAFNINMWDVGDEIRRQAGLTATEMNSLGAQYAKRAMLERPQKFLRLWMHGIAQLRIFWWSTTLAFLASAVLLVRRRQSEIATAGLIMVVVHAAQVVASAVLALAISRYVVSTLAPVVALAFPLAALGLGAIKDALRARNRDKPASQRIAS